MEAFFAINYFFLMFFSSDKPRYERGKHPYMSFVCLHIRILFMPRYKSVRIINRVRSSKNTDLVSRSAACPQVRRRIWRQDGPTQLYIHKNMFMRCTAERHGAAANRYMLPPSLQDMTAINHNLQTDI